MLKKLKIVKFADSNRNVSASLVFKLKASFENSTKPPFVSLKLKAARGGIKCCKFLRLSGLERVNG